MAVYLDDTGRTIFFGNKLFGVQPQEGMELQEHTDTDNTVAQLAQTVKAGELGIDETWPSRFLIGLMQLRPDSRTVHYVQRRRRTSAHERSFADQR